MHIHLLLTTITTTTTTMTTTTTRARGTTAMRIVKRRRRTIRKKRNGEQTGRRNRSQRTKKINFKRKMQTEKAINLARWKGSQKMTPMLLNTRNSRTFYLVTHTDYVVGRLVRAILQMFRWKRKERVSSEWTWMERRSGQGFGGSWEGGKRRV